VRTSIVGHFCNTLRVHVVGVITRRNPSELLDIGRMERPSHIAQFIGPSSTRVDIWWEALSVMIPPDVVASRPIEHRQV
jgi:hypothetical protein